MTSTKWYWNNSDYDWNIYAHVFDQNGPNDSNSIPYRYPAAKAPNNTDWLFNLPSNAICTSDNSTTSGNTLYSGTKIENQKSCNPHPYNAGNYYSFSAATAGSSATIGDIPNSICPKGWQLPPNTDTNERKKSFSNLVHTYDIHNTTSDTDLLNNSATLFIRLGSYHYVYGSLNNRGNDGHYWTSTVLNLKNCRDLGFNPTVINPQNDDDKSRGFSIRCVSR